MIEYERYYLRLADKSFDMGDHMKKSFLALAIVLLTYASVPAATNTLAIAAENNATSQSCALNAFSDVQEHLSNIKYEAVDKPLRELVPKFSRYRNSNLAVTGSADSWQVRERTATVFLTDMDIASFKGNIGWLFGYTWSTVDYGGTDMAVLWETPSSRELCASAANTKASKSRSRTLRAIAVAINDADAAAKLSPAEAESIRDKDPWMYYLATNPTGKLWTVLLQGIPNEVWDGIVMGESQSLMFDSMTPELRQSLVRILYLPPSTSTLLESEYRKQQPYGIFLRQIDPSDSYATTSLEILTKDSTGLLNAVESLPIGESQSTARQVFGFRHLLEKQGKSRDEAIKLAHTMTGVSTDSAQHLSDEPDPMLLRKIRHDQVARKGVKETDLVKHLRGLAEESGLSIMVETFSGANQECAGIPTSGTVLDILNSISRQCNLEWEINGRYLLIRYADWPERRMWEVRPEYMRRWRELAKTHKGLLFDDLSEIVRSTSYAQVKETVAKDPLLSAAGAGILVLNKDVYTSLQILNHLGNPKYKSLLCSRQGLPLWIIANLNMDWSSCTDTVRALLRPHNDSNPSATMSVIVSDLGSENRIGRQEIKINIGPGACTTIYTPSVASVDAYLKSHKPL